MGSQVVIHSRNNSDSRQRKATTDISLRSIVTKEQAEINKLKADYSSTTEDMKQVAEKSSQLISQDFDRIYNTCNLVYELLANMYFHSSARGNFSVYQKAAKDYMRQFPQYFEVQ